MAQSLEDRVGRGEIARALGIGEVAIHHHQAGRGAGQADEGIINARDLGLVHHMMSALPHGTERTEGIGANAGDAIFLGDNDGGHGRGSCLRLAGKSMHAARNQSPVVRPASLTSRMNLARSLSRSASPARWAKSSTTA